MFGAIYYLIFFVLYIIVLPVLAVLSRTKVKYKDSIPARFFLKNNGDFSGEIWIHACSLGEVASLEFIINNLSKNKQKNIILTTITHTGFSKAHELFGDMMNVKIRYLPFEIFLPFVMPKNLERLIVLEAELWYMLFASAKRVGAKTMLLNARISTKSYPKYKKNAWFYKRLFKNIDEILCQQEADKERLLTLGAKSVDIFGNIKIFNTPKFSGDLPKFSGDLIIAASTHKGEEQLVLESFLESKKMGKNISEKITNDTDKIATHIQKSKDSCLIIVPRHPERFGEVWDLLQSYPLKSAKISEVGLNYDYGVLLLDKMGELINLYNIATLVILGGSFVESGGHNPIEVAYFNAKLLSGPYIFNQYALFEAIDGYKIIQARELAENLTMIDSLPQSYIKDFDNKANMLLYKLTNSIEIPIDKAQNG